MNHFISHESVSIEKAVRLKELLITINPEHQVFLTSDWHSLESGGFWMSDIVAGLRSMDVMIVLITRKEAFSNLWINFEIGVGIGRMKKPKILVFGGVSLSEMKYPIQGMHVIDTGDTNRWILEFKRLGYIIHNAPTFAEIFGQ